MLAIRKGASVVAGALPPRSRVPSAPRQLPPGWMTPSTVAGMSAFVRHRVSVVCSASGPGAAGSVLADRHPAVASTVANIIAIPAIERFQRRSGFVRAMVRPPSGDVGAKDAERARADQDQAVGPQRNGSQQYR